MTDVLILKRIAGHRAGQIVPLDERLQGHVKAGNARILPNEHAPWDGHETEQVPATVHHVTTTGAADLIEDELDAEERDADERDAEED